VCRRSGRARLDANDAGAISRELLTMSQREFGARFKCSAIKRAKRRGLAHNAPVVLGNLGTTENVPLLEAALAHDDPLVREHAVWALARIAALAIRGEPDGVTLGAASG